MPGERARRPQTFTPRRARARVLDALERPRRPRRPRSSSARAAAARGRRSTPTASPRRSAARPTARSSSTTSPSRASTPCSVQQRRSAGSVEDQGSLNGTFVNRERVESAQLERRRRAPDRQIPAHLPPALMARPSAPSRRRLLTIGTVCGLLKDEFSDISISKIRYLKDQGLLTPKRTQGGYRLFERGRRRAPSSDPPASARRVPAAARDPTKATRPGRGKERRRRRDVCARRRRRTASTSRASASGRASRPQRARELEEFGLLEPRVESGQRIYSERRCRHRSGVRDAGALRDRHRATCAPSAPPPHREAGLIEALVAPALRSRNPERRRAGIEALQAACAERRTSSPTCSFAATSAACVGSLARVAAIDLKTRVREVPDFPEPGVGFKDISPLLARPGGAAAGGRRARRLDARAASPISCSAPRRAASGWARRSRVEVGCGFVAARRPGKLPPATVCGQLRARVRREHARGRGRRDRGAAPGSSSTTTSSRPAGRSRRSPGSSSSSAAPS